VIADFEFGWIEALIRVQELAQSDRRRGEATQHLGANNELTPEAFEGNTAYLAGALHGQTHEQAAGRNVALAVMHRLGGANFDEMIPPADMFDAKMPKVPPGKAVKGEWEDAANTHILGSGFLTATVPDRTFLSPEQDHDLPRGIAHLSVAHQAIDGAVTATKKKGVFQRREVQTNRSQVAHFVVDAQANVLGAMRMFPKVTQLKQVMEDMRYAANATFTPNESSKVAAGLELAGTAAPVLLARADAYARCMKAARSPLVQTRYPDRQVLAASFDKITGGGLPSIKRTLTDAVAMDLKSIAGSLRKQASK
jgi:hypothetical protein